MPVSLQFSDELSYDLYYSSKRRSIALQIKHGRLIVRAPQHTAFSTIEQFIRAKQCWIKKHLSLYQPSVKPDYIKSKRLPVLDDLMGFTVNTGKASEVIKSEAGLDVVVSSRCCVSNVDKKIKQLLEQWYKAHAADWFGQEVKYWQDLMQVSATSLVIGNWKTRWGYCKANGELGFNWRLLMAPSNIATYVVIHELAHLRFMHHGAEFWHMVSTHYPDYQLAIDWLKHNHARLAL